MSCIFVEHPTLLGPVYIDEENLLEWQGRGWSLSPNQVDLAARRRADLVRMEREHLKRIGLDATAVSRAMGGR